ncbi:MAG: T9SS type A sorting domain-containing protein [Gemmatimonadota bacterium]|nr:MAG: T9SS type A sorting domain-containing protein [Gemmatimonadota bacterium]
MTKKREILIRAAGKAVFLETVAFLVCVLAGMICDPAFAYEEGPRSPGTIVNFLYIAGSYDWNDPANAAASDNAKAQIRMDWSESGAPDELTSKFLVATDFGFTIPPGATIDGIEVEWEKGAWAWCDYIMQPGGQHCPHKRSAHDEAVRIVKPVTIAPGVEIWFIGTTDRSIGGVWPEWDTYVAHGGSSDLWGESWTPADINSPNFGAAIATHAQYEVQVTDYMFIDHVRITVYYTGGNETRGGCCLADNSCIESSSEDCEPLYGGTYQGDNTDCSGLEACCLPDGSCVMADSTCCVNELGGTPQGSGSQCTAVTGCCLPDGSCISVDSICCLGQGGTPLDLGVQCADTGDVNAGGYISMQDAQCAFKRFILGDQTWTHPDLQECVSLEWCGSAGSEFRADANCDGSITASDALCLAWRSLKGTWYDPQPGDNCGCLSSPKQVVTTNRSEHVTSVKLGTVEGAVGQRVSVPIVMDNPRDLDAFGLELRYPDDLLEFVGVSKTPVTENWMVIEGAVTQEGILRVGGFHTEPLKMSGPVPVAELVFIVKNRALDSDQLIVTEVMDDVAGAEIHSAAVNTRPIPNDYVLEQNYPNPFNSETRIRYQLPESGHVVLSVYNVMGQEIRRLVDGIQDTGVYIIVWDGHDSSGVMSPSGVYIYRMETGNFVSTKKMLQVK